MEAHGRKIDELIERFVPAESAILDVGCGTGINTVKLKKKTGKITGFDLKDYTKDRYRKDFQLVLGDANGLPFEKNIFDIISSWDVIEHVDDDKRFLREIHRVLKSGGRVLLSTPNRTRLSNRILNLLGKKNTYPYCLGTEEAGKDGVGEILHIREYTIKELSKLAKDQGFRVIKVEGVYLGFYGSISLGFYTVPKFLQNLTQHIFIILEK